VGPAGLYVVVQLAGAACGAWLTHAMFDVPVWQWSTKVRSGPALWLAEVVATAGLLLVILRAPAPRVAAMVAAYIGATYFFTASTSFANPAAAFGRMFSDSFAGIEPASVPAFMLAQVAGALVGWGLHRALGGDRPAAQSVTEPAAGANSSSTSTPQQARAA
jgi:glycerol uptake facilitator-like aquaporin